MEKVLQLPQTRVMALRTTIQRMTMPIRKISLVPVRKSWFLRRKMLDKTQVTKFRSAIQKTLLKTSAKPLWPICKNIERIQPSQKWKSWYQTTSSTTRWLKKWLQTQWLTNTLNVSSKAKPRSGFNLPKSTISKSILKPLNFTCSWYKTV